MKRNDYLPLNLIEKMNSRISMVLAGIALVVICVLFNRLDYNMVKKPALQAQSDTVESLPGESRTVDGERDGNTIVSDAEDGVYSVSVVAAGDNLIQESLLSSGQSSAGLWNYDHIYSQIKPTIQGADIAIVNQETPFTTDHDAVSGTEPYATPVEVGDALANAGFDVVGAATEFMASGGQELIGKTVDFWRSSHPDVKLLGIDSDSDSTEFSVIETNGIRIAFLNFVMPIKGRTANLTTAASGSSDTVYSLSLFQTEAVSRKISQAKAASDCLIVCAHWGADDEAMPTEYQKEWAAYLMQQGVNVIIGSYPHTLQPYVTLSDGSGHKTLVYYSLGNLATGQETLKSVLGGLAKFTIQKTVRDGVVSIDILNPDLELVVMHYNYDNADHTIYPLASYTEDLAQAHSIASYYGEDFSRSTLEEKADEILVMEVTPSTKTTMLNNTFNINGDMYDSAMNMVTDTDSITAVEYYSGQGAGSSDDSDEEYYDDEYYDEDYDYDEYYDEEY